MNYEYYDLMDDINKVLCLPITKIYEAMEGYELDNRGNLFHEEVSKLMSAGKKLDIKQMEHITEVSFKLVVLSKLLEAYNDFVCLVKSDNFEIGNG